jgi:hypothetical protein
MGTQQDAANAANLGSIADLFRKLGLGDLLRGQMVQVLRKQNPVASAAPGIASSEMISLPNTGKAAVISRATSRAGTTKGEFTIDGYTETAPAAGHIGISPNGDLMFAPTADTTDVDVTFLPARGDVVELTLNVSGTADTFDIPAALTARGVVYLLAAESLVGTLTGQMHILLPSDSKPATGKALLKVAHDKVLFAVADAVTRATLTLLIATDKDLNTILSADRTLL